MTDQPAPAPNLSARLGTFIATLSTRQKLIGLAVVAAVVIGLALSAGGGERVVFINGQRLGDQELAYLDVMAGQRVPDGNYWLNPQGMSWGVVGNAEPMGVVGYGNGGYDRGYGGGQGGAPQWGDVGQNYRGPFGDYMSDGQCSFVNGVPVGNC